MMGRYVDIYQVGARNMQKYHLLRATREVRKPVMLKRGMSATMEELCSARIYSGGRKLNVTLCERGIRTFENVHAQHFLIWAAIPVIRSFASAMWADPSHGRDAAQSSKMASAAVAQAQMC